MIRMLSLTIALVACSPRTDSATSYLEPTDAPLPDAPPDTPPDATPACTCEMPAMSAVELEYWHVQAALLDPRAYTFVHDTGHALDVTVPTGRTWWVVQMFQVLIGEPQIMSEDAYPGYDDTGYLRKLHVGEALPLHAGTRIRSNILKNGSYVYFCDPQVVIDLDTRYTTDPRGLYYERLSRLSKLPVRQAAIEMISGGDNSKELTLTLPTDWDAAMVVGASVYDATWVLVGGMNLMDERNNHGTVRFAQKLLAPIRRLGTKRPTGSAGVVWVTPAVAGATATITTKAGTYRGEPYGTGTGQDNGFFNRKGVGEILYAVLPSDW